MTGIPISTQQAMRLALVFASLVLSFGILSAIIGWPDKESWGLVVLVSLVIALMPLVGPVLAFLRESGAVIDIKGVKLDFTASVARGTSIERTNLQDNPGMPVNDSSAASIAETAEAARSAHFIVVDLGIGKSWYLTRLFALAAAAQELQGARAIVLLGQRGALSRKFLGWIAPKDAVTAFCERDARYRTALHEARAILHHLRLSGGRAEYAFPAPYADASSFVHAYSQTGDLALVPALIYRLQQQAMPLEQPSAPAWLDAEEAERLLDPWLIRDHIRESQPEGDKWAILARTTGEFLAVTDDNTSYRGMIEIGAVIRRAVLSPVGTKS